MNYKSDNLKQFVTPITYSNSLCNFISGVYYRRTWASETPALNRGPSFETRHLIEVLR